MINYIINNLNSRLSYLENKTNSLLKLSLFEELDIELLQTGKMIIPYIPPIKDGLEYYERQLMVQKNKLVEMADDFIDYKMKIPFGSNYDPKTPPKLIIGYSNEIIE